MKKIFACHGVLLCGWALWGLARPAVAISLDPHHGVTPKIFSPNGDGINDVVYFTVDNPRLAALSGRIMDRTGSDVTDLVDKGDGSTLTWDGRGRDGRVVLPGAYVYCIEGEGQSLCGWVMVAL